MMRNAKKIACFIVIAFLAVIGLTGCYVPQPGSPGDVSPLGEMTLCIYTDDPEALTLVINASGYAMNAAESKPITDDLTHVPYVDYIVVAHTVNQKQPNECESQRPYHVVRLKAVSGTSVVASIRVTGERRTTLLTCVYYVNGVEMPSTRNDGRNSIICRTMARV